MKIELLSKVEGDEIYEELRLAVLHARRAYEAIQNRSAPARLKDDALASLTKASDALTEFALWRSRGAY